MDTVGTNPICVHTSVVLVRQYKNKYNNKYSS